MIEWVDAEHRGKMSFPSMRRSPGWCEDDEYGDDQWWLSLPPWGGWNILAPSWTDLELNEASSVSSGQPGFKGWETA